MLSVQGLTKKFGGFTAVSSISFELAQGEILGLIGPNGSGKSTTMKMVLGLVPPTRGKVEVFGIDAEQVESRVAVGFLPENPYFQKFLTGAETVAFFGRLAGLPARKLKERARELLALVGLEEAADRRLSGYSKGMLQRIGLAQALVQEPRLLVLDEPTAGVDPAGSRDIKDLILKLKERGITVLLCSHLLAQVQEICDRIGILHRGKLVCEGPLAELIERRAQTELVLENASDELVRELEAVVARHQGARVVDRRHPQSTLEDFFLSVTGEGK